MSLERPFFQLDVFAPTVLRGNPVAVVLAAEGLSDEQMQAFANWTNLSETTFVSAPQDSEADYRVRIFTPRGELDFAGHPTLGSCKAWLAAGGKPKRAGRVIQECNIGCVELRSEGARLSFAAPPCKRSPVSADELTALTRALGLANTDVQLSARLDNGTVWVALLLRDAARVLALEPDHSALRTLAKVGAIGPYPASAECALELRAFATCNGVPEDPVTGSLNAAVADWLISEQRVPERYIASQGARLGRAGRVHIERKDSVLWVGGEVIVCVQGTVKI